MKKNFLIEKNKKINKYITPFDKHEKEFLQKKYELTSNYKNNFNKEIPEFQEKIQFFLKSRKQENNLFSKLKEKGIVEKIIKNFTEDSCFESADHLMEQTQLLLKKTNFGKRMIYEPSMTRLMPKKKLKKV